MDKNKSVEEIKQLVEKKQYSKALECLEKMDMQTELTEGDLAVFAEVYICNKQFNKAKTLLEVMFNNNASKKVISQLIFVCMIMNDLENAEKYYEEYNKIAPDDSNKYVFRYRLDKAQNRSPYTLINVLEKIAENDFVEEFAYDLAKLYFDTSNEDACIKKCNEILVLGESTEVINKANELKEKCLLELNPVDQVEDTVSSGTDIWKQFQKNHKTSKVDTSIDSIIPYKSSFESKAKSIRKDSSVDSIEAKARLSIELNARKALEEKFKEIEDKKKEAENKLKNEVIIRKKLESKLEKSENNVKKLEEKIRQDQSEKNSLLEQLNACQKESKEHNNQLRFLNDQKEEVERKFKNLDEVAKNQGEKLVRELALNRKLQEKLGENTQKITELTERLQLEDKTKSQLITQLESKESLVKSQGEQIKGCQQEIDRLNSEIRGQREKISEITGKYEVEANNVKVIDNKLNGVLNEKNELEEKIRKVEHNKRVLESNLKESIYSRKLLENKCNQNLEHKRYLENRLAKLEEERNELEDKTREQENRNIFLEDTLRQGEERYKELEKEKVREINDILAKNAAEKKLMTERAENEKNNLSTRLEGEKREIERKLENVTAELNTRVKQYEEEKKLLEERIGKSVVNNKMLDQNLKSKIDIINSLDSRIKAVMNEKKILTEQKKQLEEKLLKQIDNNKQLEDIIKKHIEGKKFLEEQIAKGQDHVNRMKEKNNQGLEIIRRLEDRLQNEENKCAQLEEKLRNSQMKCDSLDKELKQRDKMMREARDKEINLVEQSGEELLGLTDSIDSVLETKLNNITGEQKIASTNNINPTLESVNNVSANTSHANVINNEKEEFDEEEKEISEKDFDSIYDSLSSSISKFLSEEEEKEEEKESKEEGINIPMSVPILEPISFATPEPVATEIKTESQIGSFFESPEVPEYKKAYEDSQSLVSKLFGGSDAEISKGEYNYEPSIDEKQMYYQQVMQSQMVGGYNKVMPMSGQYLKETLSPEIFGYYYSSPFIMDQVQRGIFNIKNEPTNNNFVITGPQCYNKNELSKMIARQMHKKNIVTTNKIARITGEAFNKVDLDSKVDKLIDGCIVIQNAEAITNVAFSKLIRLITTYKNRVFVILESDKDEYQLFSNSQNARQFFGSVVKLPVYSVDFLMEYSKTFLVDNNMGISEEAENTLAGVFNNKLNKNDSFTLQDVANYMLSSIDAASKRKKGKGKHPTDIVIRQDINTNW